MAEMKQVQAELDGAIMELEMLRAEKSAIERKLMKSEAETLVRNIQLEKLSNQLEANKVSV